VTPADVGNSIMGNDAQVVSKAAGPRAQESRLQKMASARAYALLSLAFAKNRLFYVVLSLGMFALGYILRPLGDHNATPAATASVRANTGPWGDLEVTPITISAPEEYLIVEQVEKRPTRWIFKNRSRDDLARLFDSLDLPKEQKDAWLSSSVVEVAPDGVVLTPSSEMLMGLSEKARRGIFDLIAGTLENEPALEYIGVNSIDERFRTGNVSSATVELFKKMSCKRGDYYVFSGVGNLVSALPTRDEKIRFLRAMSQQKTMLIRLHINPQTDINSLVRYWGKERWAVNANALLESVAALPGDNSIDLVELLPPFPSSMLYNFPPNGASGAGAPVRRDCHWTSLNFFNDVPDDRFTDPAYVKQKLLEDYTIALFDRRYGDVVLMQKPDESIVHSAVYLADDIVYTKNGDTPVHPWMFSTLSELKEQYACVLPPDQKLEIRYYRKKSLDR
jgi:hypothetical protein